MKRQDNEKFLTYNPELIITEGEKIMELDAIVQQVNMNSLLVREIDTNNEYIVNVSNTRGFARGNCVRINHTGQMTLSIPPQITAISIRRILCNPVRPSFPPRPSSSSRPSEMTAITLQKRRNELLVRDIDNNRQVIVRTPHADHFCIRQRIVITYDSIRMNNPPEVEAISIRSLC